MSGEHTPPDLAPAPPGGYPQASTERAAAKRRSYWRGEGPVYKGRVYRKDREIKPTRNRSLR